jgi:fructose-specific component phosphotransferase system IIB-like protein|tara:strand:+ start:1619 stop:2290 length:672 start_codon:yes stop_codon:yes gene_type:complete
MHIRESRRDFRQRYRTCTVLAKLNNDVQKLFYIDDIDEDLEYISGSVITDDNEWLPTKWYVGDIEIDFRFPKLALLNAKKGVVRLSRHATQQYRQSFNPTVINIIHLNMETCEIFDLPTLNYEDLSQPLFIKDIFFPSYFTASGAINRITSGDRYAGAISKDLYISTSWNTAGLFLGYKEVLVGKMREDSMYPTVDLFNGNNDLIDLIQLQNIRVGGMLNVQR